MDKQHVKGAAKEVAGKVQKKTGDLLDDHSMEAKGAAKEAAGKAQQKLGDAKDTLRDARDEALDADAIDKTTTHQRTRP
ncbi:MAG TPA: CsbD family protein [Gemmatimonadales bacterium]|nr:CsbD family protein [Gemmatimonadales bacterium]